MLIIKLINCAISAWNAKVSASSCSAITSVFNCIMKNYMDWLIDITDESWFSPWFARLACRSEGWKRSNKLNHVKFLEGSRYHLVIWLAKTCSGKCDWLMNYSLPILETSTSSTPSQNQFGADSSSIYTAPGKTWIQSLC